MKINELLNTEQLDEGWKEKAAGALAAVALAGGMHASDAEAGQKHHPKHAVVKKVHAEPALQKVLQKTAERAGIKGVELAQFLAQSSHETLGFRKLEEIGSKKQFKRYEHGGIARALGNTEPGDGERFKGRGFLQLTGRYNYEKAGEALGLPLLKHPEMLAEPNIAAKVAVWYWKHRVRPHVNDFEDTKAVTFKINPALHGLERREETFLAMKDELEV